MNYQSEFDKLSKNLNEEERRDLLSKIKKEDDDSDPDLLEDGSKSKYNKQLRIAENAYAAYGFLTKLIVWFLSLFSGKKKNEVVLERMFQDLKKEIQRINPNIIDFNGNLLTPEFIGQISNLSELCGAGLPIIDQFFGDTIYYNGFISWLIETSFNEDLLHAEKEALPDKFTIKSDFVDRDNYINEKDKRIRKFFEKLSLTSFNDYNIYFSKFELVIKLITFDFKTLIWDFSANKNAYGIKFSIVSNLLEKLFILMHSIDFTYSEISYINKINEYNKLKENYEKPLANVEISESQLDLIKDIINNVTQLKKKIPFKLIFQYFKKDLLYKPLKLQLPVDAVKIYKEHKRNALNLMWDKNFSKIQTLNLEKMIKDLFGEYRFDSLKFFNLKLQAQVDKYSHIKLAAVKKINILYVFLEKIYKKDIEKLIHKLILEGDFSKETHRNSFSSSYYLLFNSLNTIREYDKKFDPEHDIGKKLFTLLRYKSGEVDYTQTLQNTVIDINNLTHKIIEDLIEGLWGINNNIADLIKYSKSEKIIENLDKIKLAGYMSVIQAITKVKKSFDVFFNIYNMIDEF